MKDNRCGPPLPVHESYKLMWDIAFGMLYLYQKGVLHRDLKATNFLLVNLRNRS
jgi:serine/threonine protein kinase